MDKEPSMDFRKPLALLAVLLGLGPAAAFAQKMDKDAKKWLDDVRPIILADEEKTYRELKDKGERDEFQKIFWARRDPNPQTPANEFQEAYLAARAEADTLYKVGTTRGSETDCGRVFILLGKPDEVKAEPVGETPMLRTAETWTYRDRPGQTFTGGEAKISFAGNCQLPQGNRFGESLNQLAQSKIRNANIGYRKGDNGKLVSLADQLPKPSPAQTLLATPRQDFTLAAEPSMYLPSPDGTVFVAGLVRADAAALARTPAAPAPGQSKLTIATRAVDASGQVFPGTERLVNADVGADNMAVASFGLALRPGTYTLHVAVADAQGKGSATTVPLTVPDFGAGNLILSPLTLLSDFQDTVTTKKSDDPLADFVTGAGRLVPRYGNVFTPADSLTVIAQVRNNAAAPATGAAPAANNTVAVFSILKDGKTVAKSAEQTGAVVSVGPVPLNKYTPGKYTVQLKVTDSATKKDYTSEATFQIAPATPPS
jgi:GWxTD domain-containing protein